MTNQTSANKASALKATNSDAWDEELGKAAMTSDSNLDFATIRGVLWRQRFVFVTLIPVSLILGFVLTLLITPEFRATSSLQIDTNPVVIVDGQEQQPVGREIRAYKETLARVIKSRTVATRVSEMLQLSRTMGPNKSEKPAELSDDAWEKRRQASIVSKLISGLTVEPEPNANIVSISYTSVDAVMAAKIANAYADAVLAEDLERNLAQSEYARTYLQKQIKQLQDKLANSEQQSIAYARSARIVSGGMLSERDDSNSEGADNAGAMPKTISGSNLAGINQAYTAAKAARISAQQRWEAVRSLPAATLAEVQTNTSIQSLISDRSKALSDLANLRTRYGEDYPPARELRAKIATLDSQIQSQSEAIKTGVKVAYETALRQEGAFFNEVGKVSDATLDEQSRRVQFGQLSRETASYRSQLDAMLARYNALSAAANIAPSTLTKLDDAQVPSSPVSPDIIKNLIISAIFGLALAGAAAILREIFDDRLRTVADVERKLGLATLGVTPKLTSEELKADSLVLREAYASISTSIEFAMPNVGSNLLAVTSSQSSEGKSTTSLYTAKTLASHGRKVLLIDGDLRKPAIATRAGFARPEVGLTEVLLDKVSLADALLPNIQENLDILPTGSIPAQPVEILSSSRFREFLARCRSTYSVVIIDAPPVVGIADAPIIANLVDGTIFVIEANSIDAGKAKAALRRLRGGDAHMLGSILAKFDSLTAGQSYAYNYMYYQYGERA